MKRSTKLWLGVGAMGVAGLGIGWLWWRQSGISLALHGVPARALPSGVGNLAHALGAPAPAPITRASCLECVDKHLGAAWVLITETRDGYPHRLRAIGHLHEAEDESQAFPVLHDAIRAARKDYQQNDVTPPFEVLEQLSRKLRG